MLVLERVTKRFGDLEALSQVSLKVEGEGSLIAVIGPNGAGKTTLINVISGVLKPEKGRIFFNGVDITDKSIEQRVRSGIVKSYQLVKIFSNQTVEENVLIARIVAREVQRKLLTSVSKINGLREEVEEILDMFLLKDVSMSRAGNIPHGKKKLLDVALAYAMNSKLLLLDEPTSGLSIAERDQVMKIITKVVKSRGITAIVVEHDMDVVFNYADRVLYMHEGKILVDGPPAEVINHEIVRSMIGG